MTATPSITSQPLAAPVTGSALPMVGGLGAAPTVAPAQPGVFSGSAAPAAVPRTAAAPAGGAQILGGLGPAPSVPTVQPGVFSGSSPVPVAGAATVATTPVGTPRPAASAGAQIIGGLDPVAFPQAVEPGAISVQPLQTRYLPGYGAAAAVPASAVPVAAPGSRLAPQPGALPTDVSGYGVRYANGDQAAGAGLGGPVNAYATQGLASGAQTVSTVGLIPQLAVPGLVGGGNTGAQATGGLRETGRRGGLGRYISNLSDNRAPLPAAFQPDPTVPAITDEDTLIRADSLEQDSDLSTIIARGEVELASGINFLRADVVSYNTTHDRVTASGNVTVTDMETGEVTFGNYMELTGDLKDGFVRDVQLLLINGARLRSNYMEFDSANQRKEFSRVVYTACSVCEGRDLDLPTVTGNEEGDDTVPPVWQIKADRMTHDEADKNVIYHDAWIEAFGVPVFYTPYYSHPDPTVYRRTGFLTPSTGYSEELGATTFIPYYIVWDEQTDTSIALNLMEQDNLALELGGGHRFAYGEFYGNGAVVPYDYRNNTEWWYQSEGFLDIDRKTRAGFESSYTSSPAYLIRHGITPTDNPTFLTNRPYVERFEHNSFAQLEGFYFLSRRADVTEDQTPFVYPNATVSYLSDPLEETGGGRVYADANFLNLGRRVGQESTRFVTDVGYEHAYIDSFGARWTGELSTIASSYWVEDLERTGFQDYTGSEFRFVPKGHLTWSYPFVRPSGRYRHVIEPTGSFVASPYLENPDTIPNEDTQATAVDYQLLFEKDRVPGYDRIETGVWGAYGLKYAIHADDNEYFEAAIGQGYRLREDPDLLVDGTGLEENFSDYAARLYYTNASNFTVTYSTQLKRKNLEPRGHRLSGSWGSNSFILGLSYLYVERLEDQSGTRIRDAREEVSVSGNVRLARYWNLNGSHTYDMDRQEPVSTSLRFVYEDECFQVENLFTRDHTQAFGVEGSYTYLLTFTLKTVGDYASNPEF
ncbi:MAG: LPS assembly protein LptD [Rhodospirillaceae bacterium]